MWIFYHIKNNLSCLNIIKWGKITLRYLSKRWTKLFWLIGNFHKKEWGNFAVSMHVSTIATCPIKAVQLLCTSKNWIRITFFIFIFLTDITHSWASAGPNCIIWRLCHSPMVSMLLHIELADKLYNSVTVRFCASQKYVFHIGWKR